MNVTEEMLTRFLSWKLPSDFMPDAGITFKRVYNESSPYGPSVHEPTGTNLFTADQARAMLEYVLSSRATEPDRNAAKWQELLEAVMREMPERTSRAGGNAPGHGHDKPGIWDSDNGKLAGKPCAWCLVWNEARAALATEPDRNAARYLWLRDEGSLTWVPFRSQWQMSADKCDQAIGDEMDRAALATRTATKD